MWWIVAALVVLGVCGLIWSLRRTPNWLVGECYCGDIECGGGCSPRER